MENTKNHSDINCSWRRHCRVKRGGKSVLTNEHQTKAELTMGFLFSLQALLANLCEHYIQECVCVCEFLERAVKAGKEDEEPKEG